MIGHRVTEAIHRFGSSVQAHRVQPIADHMRRAVNDLANPAAHGLDPVLDTVTNGIDHIADTHQLSPGCFGAEPETSSSVRANCCPYPSRSAACLPIPSGPSAASRASAFHCAVIC